MTKTKDDVGEGPGRRPLGGPVSAPGRYCLTVCYCGGCDHYRPLPPIRDQITTTGDATQAESWANREESTWLDR